MKDKAIDKIKKLIRLGRSSEPHEAALALQRARELMNKYGVNETDIAMDNIREANSSSYKSVNLPIYLMGLAQIVSELFQCEYYINSGYEVKNMDYIGNSYLTFVGYNPSQDLAQYTCDVLSRKLLKQRREYKATARKRYNKTKQKDSYAMGWVSGVRRNIMHMIPEKIMVDTVTETGLVSVNQLEVYVNENTKGQAKCIDRGFQEKHALRGYIDGRETEINKAMKNGSDKLALNG